VQNLAVRNRDVVRITLVVALTLFGLWLIYALRHVVLLAGVSAFLAIALEPGVSFIQRLVRSRGLAIAIMLFALLLSTAAFVASVVPPISEQVRNLIDNIPEYSEALKSKNTAIGRLFVRYDVPERLKSAVGNASAWAAGIGSVFGTVASVITNFLVVLVLTLYFLFNAPRLKREGLRLVPPSRRVRVGSIVDKVFAKVGGWMEGNILVSVAAGIVGFVGLLLIGVPYPHALAMWVAIADLIPMVGALLGAVVCTIVAAIAGGPVQGAVTLAFFLAYQQVENYVIQPRIMKRTVDVSAATVILSAMAGGTLLGPIGVLLAVPGAASIKVVANELMGPDKQRLHGRGKAAPLPPPPPAAELED
jgi:predicted PurR-regulated permease PerM